MLRLFIVVFTLITIIGCDKSKLSDKEKYQIYGVVFDNSVGEKSEWRKKAKGSLRWIQNSISTKEDSFRQRNLLHWLDSINRVIDTSNLYVLLEDTLVKLYSDGGPMESIVQQNKVLKNDTSFVSLFKTLLSNDKSIEVIDKSKIKSSNKYNLVNKEFIPRDEFTEVGILSVSKISVNGEKNKACVYTSLICGEMCGHGRVFFLEKKAGKWLVSYHVEIWVS